MYTIIDTMTGEELTRVKTLKKAKEEVKFYYQICGTLFYGRFKYAQIKK